MQPLDWVGMFKRYVGDDINDLPCLRMVGFPVAVGDAHPDVRAAAALVLGAPGGRGSRQETDPR